MIGRELGKWKLDALLGEGGVASVYAATHRNGRRGAVKVLHASLADDADARARFLQEGYAANAVKHAGAVRVLDDDVTPDGFVYLVMELLEGETLEDMRERLGGKLPLDAVHRYGIELCEILSAAHAQGIIHRDIKPENLFVQRNGGLKVLDFGLAKLKQAMMHEEATAVGVLIGTPGFMPPERSFPQDDIPDPRTDIWAVGATLFLLTSGELVHDGRTPLATLAATARSPARSLRKASASATTELVAIVDRALAFKKEERFESADEMKNALAEALHALEMTETELVAAKLPRLSEPDLEPQTAPLVRADFRLPAPSQPELTAPVVPAPAPADPQPVVTASQQTSERTKKIAAAFAVTAFVLATIAVLLNVLAR